MLSMITEDLSPCSDTTTQRVDGLLNMAMVGADATPRSPKVVFSFLAELKASQIRVKASQAEVWKKHRVNSTGLLFEFLEELGSFVTLRKDGIPTPTFAKPLGEEPDFLTAGRVTCRVWVSISAGAKGWRLPFRVFFVSNSHGLHPSSDGTLDS